MNNSQSHYWTPPMKRTFNWVTEKRTMNGELLEVKPFESKMAVNAFLHEKKFYVNGELVHTCVSSAD